MTQSETLHRAAGIGFDQHMEGGALADELACSSDDEESVDVLVGGDPAKAPNPTASSTNGTVDPADMSTANHAEVVKATTPALPAAQPADDTDTNGTAPKQEAAAVQPEGTEGSAAAGIAGTTSELDADAGSSMSRQPAPDAPEAAADGVADKVHGELDVSAATQQPAGHQLQGSSTTESQAASSPTSAANESLAGTTANRPPADQPATDERQVSAADTGQTIADSGSTAPSETRDQPRVNPESKHADKAARQPAAQATTPGMQTLSAKGMPDGCEGSLPRTSTPQQVLHGLRERESQPYHMRPALPERISLGHRPRKNHVQQQRPDSPVRDTSNRDDGVSVEQRAQQKLQEAQRLRELDRQRLREQMEREQADSKTQHAVVAHCALRAGAAGGAECQAGSRQRSICGNQSHVYFACSEGCEMSYHHPVCYHLLVDTLRRQRPGFKGFKGKNSLPCLTDMCSGMLVEATLRKVSSDGKAEPPVAWIQRPKKAAISLQSVVEPRQPDSKHNMIAQKSGHQQSSELPGAAADSQQQQHDQHQQSVQPEQQSDTAEQPSPREEPVRIPLPEELDARLREYKREEVPDRLAVPRRKQHPQHPAQQETLAAQHARLERKKKVVMHMRLDQFVGEQLSEGGSLDSHQQHSTWGRHDVRAQHQDDGFLPPASSGNGAALATAAFPSLQQALQGGAEASESAMVVLAALRQMQQDQRWGMPTDILLLECIDVTGVAEEMGCADADAALEDQLHAVFDMYGDIQRLRTFPDQEAAAIQFSDASAAARAKVHEDGRQMGRKPMRTSHLTRFPTDSAIDEVIRAQLEVEEGARSEAQHVNGHLPSRGQRAPAWDIGSDLSHHSSHDPAAAAHGHASSTHGSLDAQAPEFQPRTPLSAVVNAPEFVPGATWQSGSLGSAGGLGRLTSHGSGASVPKAEPGQREEDPLALVAQLERDEEMARALAAENSALARQMQEDERLAREMAGEGSGLVSSRPTLPARSETWAAEQQPPAPLDFSLQQQVSPQQPNDPDSPVGPDVWGHEDDAVGPPAGLQPDAAFMDAWGDSGSEPQADSGAPNVWAASPAAGPASDAARGWSSPAAAQPADTTQPPNSGSIGGEDLRFQPVPAQEEDVDDDDPFGWMMDSGCSTAGGSATEGAAAPLHTADAATTKPRVYNPTNTGTVLAPSMA